MKLLVIAVCATLTAGPATAQLTNCMANGPFLYCSSSNGSFTTCNAVGTMLNCNTVGGETSRSRPGEEAGNGAAANFLGFLEQMKANRRRARIGRAMQTGDCPSAVREALGTGDVDYARSVQALCAQAAAASSSTKP